MQWIRHCVPWQVDIVGVLFGLWPRFCLLFFGVSPFDSLFPLAKRKFGWSFAGRRVWVAFVVLVCCFNRFDASMDLICPCTNVFPAYAHVRTEALALV